MNRLRLRFFVLFALALLAAVPAWAVPSKPSDESEVRAVVQSIFEQLRTGQYAALYDSLPSSSRARISRERFSSALQRSTGTYRLDKLEIGMIRVSGNFAVVDTTMYGSIQRPFAAEGKIVAQQYLVREEGQWRVATGDRATVRRFLTANPGFTRKFRIRQPKVFVKRDGGWVDLTEALKQTRKASE